jgi:ABC-type multidrug transport system fused ATPase/permease subunit
MPLKKNPFFKGLSWKRGARLFHYFRADLYRVRWELILALICTLGTTLAVVARPWPIKIVFDYALIPMHDPRWALPFDLLKGYSAMGVVTWSCALLLGIALLWGLFSYQQRYLIASAGQRLIFMVRRRLFAHLQRLSLSVHNAHKTGDLVLRATGDANMLRDMLVDSTLIILSDFIVLFAMVGVMLYLDWRLTTVSLAVLPLMTLTAFRFSHGIREAVRKQRQRDGRMASILSEVLHGIMLVQAFGRERHEDERFAGFNRRNLRSGLRAVRLEAGLDRTVEILVATGTAGVIWFGVRRVLQGYITPGDLLVFTGYLASMYRPLRRMARLTARLSKATVCGERIYDILAVKERVKQKKSAYPAPAFKGHVSFQDVSFHYRTGRPVLRSVSFDVEPGQLVGLVGANGAGKSTLLALIPRLYDPLEGKVRIDGERIKRFTLDSVREQIGIVLQQPILFGTTIHENIAYGKPDASLDEVIAAAKAADVYEFIASLPDGYETVIAEDGASLSGGQRQKISIARAIIKNPPVLLLDEPTTGLDATSAAEVNATLHRLRQMKTTFRVAHRLEDVATADLILVLRDGQIIERGTHAELVDGGGWYQRVSAHQGIRKVFAAEQASGAATRRDLS